MLRRIAEQRTGRWGSSNVRLWADRELKRIINDWPQCEPCRPGTASEALRKIAEPIKHRENLYAPVPPEDNAAAVDEACYELMILEEVTKSGDKMPE